MKLCEIFNQTFATINLGIKELLSIEDDNRLTGIAGNAVDKLLIKPQLRKCKIIGEADLGEKLDNDTYTGNLGILQRKEALAYIKTESPVISEPWLSISIPLITENFVVLMDIGPSKAFQHYNLLNNLNLGWKITIWFLFSVSFSVLFAFFIIFFILKHKTDLNTSKLFKKAYHFGLHMNTSFLRAFSAIAVFMIFYRVFIWISANIITGNVNTNSIVVDTSEIVANLEDALYKTKRIFCVIDQDTEQKIIKLSSKENILRKLFDRKSQVNRPISGLDNMKNCILQKSEKSALIDTYQVFTVISEQSAYVIAYFIANVKTNVAGFMSRDPIFVSNLHIFHIETERYMENMLMSYLEGGLFVNLIKNVQRNSMLVFRKTNRAYFSVEEYKQDLTKFEHLRLENFKQIFVIYSLFFCGILFVFIICRFIRPRFKFRKKIQRRKHCNLFVTTRQIYLFNRQTV